MYRVKSKSGGSYFGSYASLKAAEADAEEANEEVKYGKSDWEPEEKEEEGIPDEVEEAFKTIRRALRRKAGGKEAELYKDRDGKWYVLAHGSGHTVTDKPHDTQADARKEAESLGMSVMNVSQA
jgi:hypothetical protein